MTITATSTPSDSLFQRLKRVAPWFAGHPGALVLGIVGILIGSATEPAIPALMKPLLDNGFDRGTLELWKIPAVLLLLFGVRGFAGFIAAYCLAFITGMLMLISPIKHLSEVAGTLTRGVTSLERGLNLLDLAPDETQGTHTSAHAKGEICFDHVTLQYPSATSPALNGVNLTIQPGQTVAFVGPSGSGKTTLANLLPRFLEPTSGQVRLDGVPLKDWSLASLRSQVAFVSQDVIMFNDSVAQNIALGETVDTARVWSALEAANLGDFVRGLPNQENTLVGHNATQLSGGQRQRLAIARAIYKDAPILILDEATSALDTASEQAVKEALNVLMQGRTSLIIAHRLSTIEHADLIVVMQAGSIVETGTHSQLMTQSGAYAALYQVAAQSTDNHFADTSTI